MNKFLKLIIALILPLMVGVVSGFVTAQDVTSSWYNNLHKPFFNPPNAVFAPVWSALYIFMGIAFYNIWIAPATRYKSKALWLFAVQLVLNFWWSIVFFAYHQIGLALLDITGLWISIVAMIYYFYNVKPWVGYLQIPYLAWVSFATILNTAFWILNS